MGLIRFLVLALVFWLLFRLFRQYWDRLPRTQKKTKGNIDNMVRCHHCGVHIPEKEAIEDNGRFYCSSEHQQADEED